ncbi:MAG TPA: thioesterase family protein [Polyangiaceae bacterium]|jgi:acyl-CoA thioesterase
MRFADVLDSLSGSGTSFTVDVSEDWRQGRSVFGGLQAALALRAMRPFAEGLPLRVLQTTFVAPMLGATRIDVAPLRSGKTTRHVEARLSNAEGLVALVVGIFGAPRPSEVNVVPRQPRIESAPVQPFVRAPGLPAFLAHFDVRWRRGGPPAAGLQTTESSVEVSFGESGLATEEHVVALSDVPPPHALTMLPRLAVGSSLTWSLEILHGGEEWKLEALPLGGWRLDIDLVAARSGYTSQSVLVWGPGAELVAISRQCMVVFA